MVGMLGLRIERRGAALAAWARMSSAVDSRMWCIMGECLDITSGAR